MAATLLALALIAAAAAPLLSLLPSPSPPQTKGLTYSILPGSVEMALTKGSLRPGTILRLMVSSIDGNKKEMLLAATAAIVTSKGEAEVHIPKSNVPADAASLKIVSEFDGDSGPKQETTEITLRQLSQPAQRQTLLRPGLAPIPAMRGDGSMPMLSAERRIDRIFFPGVPMDLRTHREFQLQTDFRDEFGHPLAKAHERESEEF